MMQKLPKKAYIKVMKNEINNDNTTYMPRNPQQLHNLKYSNKTKVFGPIIPNIADKYVQVINMIQLHPFVVKQLKSEAFLAILYVPQQIQDVKRFCFTDLKKQYLELTKHTILVIFT